MRLEGKRGIEVTKLGPELEVELNDRMRRRADIEPIDNFHSAQFTPSIHRSIDPSIHRSIGPSIHQSIDPSALPLSPSPSSSIPHRDRPIERPRQQRVPRDMLAHAAHQQPMVLQRRFALRLLFTRPPIAYRHQVIDHDRAVLAPGDHIRVRVVENTLDFVLLRPMRFIPACQPLSKPTRSAAALSLAPTLRPCWMSCWRRSTGHREKPRRS